MNIFRRLLLLVSLGCLGASAEALAQNLERVMMAVSGERAEPTAGIRRAGEGILQTGAARSSDHCNGWYHRDESDDCRRY